MAEFGWNVIDSCSVEIDDDVIKKYVLDNFEPEQVFDPFELDKWALANGYITEDDE